MLGNPRGGEEVRDGPHGDNRCGGNRGGVAPAANSLRPWPGLYGVQAFALRPFCVALDHR